MFLWNCSLFYCATFVTLQSSCCRPLFTFIPLYQIIQSPVSSTMNVSLLRLHIKEHWCPLQCNPHLPSNAIVSKYPSPQNNTHTHAGIPLCCISTHSPLETNYHFNCMCCCIIGCPLPSQIFTFLFVNCCVCNTPTVDCCIRTTLHDILSHIL